MKKVTGFIVVLLVAISGYYGFVNLGPDGIKQAVSKLLTTHMTVGVPPASPTDTIKIASFNIQVFGEKKIHDTRIVDVLVKICRHFDVIAIQEIRSVDDNVIPLFIDALNADGSHYDYVIGPRLGRTSSKEQYAYIFDTASIECDRNQLYTLDDKDDLLHRDPLIGWFRVRGPKPEQAFTFTLADVHTDPDEVAREVNVLDDAFFAIRDDGRKEDDVIMLGDFNADNEHLGELGQIPNLGHVIADHPTNTRGTHQYDNMLFDSQATVEFTGHGGVFDYLRDYNLSMEEALLVSDHLPIWAEFSVFEGGRPTEVANRTTTAKPVGTR